MSKLVTIFGGSGFLGRYVARRLAKEGWRVRVAVRDPNLAGFVRMYGHVGQVVPVACNIRDDESVRAVLSGADAAVNCVGTFDRKGRNSFQAIHVDAAARVARLCLDQGVRRLVHVSALGADLQGRSEYARSKAQGEQAVLEHMPHAVILRPSIMFGQEDNFFNRFATMASRGPVLPVIGADTAFQPVWVDDVAAAAALGVNGRAAPGIYELGGPEVATFRELMQRMLGVIRRRRPVIGLPFWLGSLMGTVFEAGRTVTGGLAPLPVTRDQVASLRSPNVATGRAPGFEALGIAPTAMESVLPDYLWRFRPSGQYAAIQESARNLRA
ncbi:NAD-dependent epimerase/dehydratase [Rubellimicrobium mesophilum DSM 19309]|uniref:NAD-dependent epimerase/dehydratase n=1 Tax=Rubellimicrobium mesophilum DSM 19309 TaxID=442562 RepID=A0A017HPR5_9RHOB|nr:complex I NDUFA9 subunit family protein [Rubellimicrobium mesophilum]EYD76371.1 NAD-dependent epimerase/dehydratase [Rubellimicrobium mesophilum DSM 19309]